MNRPSNKDLTDTTNKIRHAANYHGGWDALERRLREMNDRDRRGGNAWADGYPAGTLGGGSGPSVIVTDEDTGENVRVPLTSVEAATIARLDNNARRDEFHRHVERAVGWADEAARCVGALVNSLDRIDKLLGTPVVVEHCASCRTAGLEEDDTDLPLRFGRVGEVLERNEFLCRSCYKFAENNTRLPSPDELRRHRETGKWRLRAS